MLSLSHTQLTQVLAQQRFLEQTADIYYTCYAFKISLREFYQVYLWDYLGLNPTNDLDDPIVEPSNSSLESPTIADSQLNKDNLVK